MTHTSALPRTPTWPSSGAAYYAPRSHPGARSSACIPYAHALRRSVWREATAWRRKWRRVSCGRKSYIPCWASFLRTAESPCGTDGRGFLTAYRRCRGPRRGELQFVATVGSAVSLSTHDLCTVPQQNKERDSLHMNGA